MYTSQFVFCGLSLIGASSWPKGMDTSQVQEGWKEVKRHRNRRGSPSVVLTRQRQTHPGTQATKPLPLAGQAHRLDLQQVSLPTSCWTMPFPHLHLP